MFKRATLVVALVVAVPAFSASTPTAQQCRNPNGNNALCLFNNTGQGTYDSGSASSLVAMVGSVCALPLRLMSQWGKGPAAWEEESKRDPQR